MLMLSSPPLVNRRYLRALFSGQSAKSEHYWAEHRRRLRDLDTYLLNHLKHRPHLGYPGEDPLVKRAEPSWPATICAELKAKPGRPRSKAKACLRGKIHDNLTRSR